MEPDPENPPIDVVPGAKVINPAYVSGWAGRRAQALAAQGRISYEMVKEAQRTMRGEDGELLVVPDFQSASIEELQPLCSLTTNGKYPTAPFNEDGYTWATDGTVLVRTKTIEGLSGASARLRPMNWWIRFPSIPMREQRPAIPEDVHQQPCEACVVDSELEGFKPPESPCWLCGGTGFQPGNEPVEVDGFFFRGGILDHIAKLPGVVMAAAEDYQLPSRGYLRFAWPNGEGVYLGLTRTAPREESATA